MVKSDRELVFAQLAGMPDSEPKFRHIKFLYDRGEIDESDLYELLVQSIRNNPRFYFEKIAQDDLLSYMWKRFEEFPEALARALVRVCPEIFYGDLDWVTRLVIQLQSDLKLKAELGMITVHPRKGGGGGRRVIEVDESLLAQIPREVEDLDISCRVRELLYWYSRDSELGRTFAQEQLDAAGNEYEHRVWKQARDQMEALLNDDYIGAIATISDDRLFPAPHVRWWLRTSSSQARVLNIGDTGTYKTSYAAIAVRQAGCRHTLVFCAPGARTNWRRELRLYYPHLKAPGRIHVITKRTDAEFIPANAEFVIVGYTALIHQDVVDTLKAQPFDGIIWDECHYGKNVTGVTAAKRAVGCLQIIEHHQEGLLKLVANSATPWENSPEEIAVLACVLRPDVFTAPEIFRKTGVFASPRFLRALFDTCILEISLHEVRELPNIEPKPWEDLFAVEPVEMTGTQARLYSHMLEHVPENGGSDRKLKKVSGIDGTAKVRHLLVASDMPHVLVHEDRYDWPGDMADSFEDEGLSAKLAWLKAYIDKHIETGKFAIGTAMYVQGVTRPVNGFGEESFWVGRLLQEWYGEDRVLLLDGNVAAGSSKRKEIINRWRTDPEARILLVSMRTCPDSINLSVTCRDDSLDMLHVIAFAHDWKPWKQFLGRFWREGLTVPMTYGSPVLCDTADEARLELIRRKWEILLLFKARVPPTEAEWAFLKRKSKDSMSDLMKSPAEWVSEVNNDVRGCGEELASEYLGGQSGTSTAGLRFAESFLACQEGHASGHISRFMCNALTGGLIPGGILDDPRLILDAGCGPATMARRLELPVVGVDMNPWMVSLAKETDPANTVNTTVGRLSELPDEWDKRFRMTVSSMVLDWTELDQSETEPERLRVLNRLIQVTDPYGLIWLTFNSSSMKPAHYASWVQMLQRAGCEILPLSGWITPRGMGGKKKPKFDFWSILFSPNGRKIRLTDGNSLLLAFEVDRTTYKRGGHRKPKREVKKKQPEYSRFDVVNPLVRGKPFVEDTVAIKRTLLKELNRGASKPGAKPVAVGGKAMELFGGDWRTLEALRTRGIITFGSSS